MKTIALIGRRLAGWREWELNPIVIKELRQAVRSWAVTGMLLLFLTALFIISVGFLVFQSFGVDQDTGLGGEMFSWFASILAFASIFFIPLYLGIRVAAERQENNPDLLYVSTLSPARIIRGKFMCGAYMTILFFSACMPFMAFTNLMRGVDLPTVFFILFYLFLAVCAANMVAIFLACIPASRPFRVLFALVGFIGAFWVVIPVLNFAFLFLHSGIGATMGGRDFWMGALTSVAVCLAVTGLFFFLSVALISPPSANRALPVRLYITAIWLLGGLLCLAWVFKTHEADTILAWVIPTFLLMILSLLTVIGNSDQLSRRVRRMIPRSPWKRLPAFLFFNGAAGGILWVALVMSATALAAAEIFSLFPAFSRTDRYWLSWVAVGAYIFAYALTGLVIQRKFFPRRPPKLAGLLTALVAAICALAPSIVLFFLNRLTWASIEGLELGNVFNVFSMRDDSRVVAHLYFAFGWLALMLVINTGWFIRQARSFAPPPAEPPPILNPDP